MTVFSTLDNIGISWEVEISQEGMKTLFLSCDGQRELIGTRLGLKVALSTFQWAVNVIPSTMQWKHALIYLENIVTISKGTKARVEHVKNIFLLLHRNGVTIELKTYILT